VRVYVSRTPADPAKVSPVRWPDLSQCCPNAFSAARRCCRRFERYVRQPCVQSHSLQTAAVTCAHGCRSPAGNGSVASSRGWSAAVGALGGMCGS